MTKQTHFAELCTKNFRTTFGATNKIQFMSTGNIYEPSLRFGAVRRTLADIITNDLGLEIVEGNGFIGKSLQYKVRSAAMTVNNLKENLNRDSAASDNSEKERWKRMSASPHNSQKSKFERLEDSENKAPGQYREKGPVRRSLATDQATGTPQ